MVEQGRGYHLNTVHALFLASLGGIAHRFCLTDTVPSCALLNAGTEFQADVPTGPDEVAPPPVANGTPAASVAL